MSPIYHLPAEFLMRPAAVDPVITRDNDGFPGASDPIITRDNGAPLGHARAGAGCCVDAPPLLPDRWPPNRSNSSTRNPGQPGFRASGDREIAVLPRTGKTGLFFVLNLQGAA